jgi:glutathione synthase/RimK-type ligase-like ATP-grasp enzyme
MDRGSQLAVHSLSSKETTIAEKTSRELKNRKIRLAAVDLIDDWITDFNFTSPGLIPQMEALLSINLARPVIEALTRQSD